LAARGALDTHRATIDVMHGIGAEDQQLVRLFVRQIAIDALSGGSGRSRGAGLVIASSLAGPVTPRCFRHAAARLDDALLLLLLPIASRCSRHRLQEAH
jgi:cell division transport system permease protein